MNDLTGNLFDIRRFAIHDGPGIRTTIFFKGCPLNCWWCHNPESQNLYPEIILRSSRCVGCGACVDVCETGAAQMQNGRSFMEWEKCSGCGYCVEVCYAEGRQWVGQKYSVDEVMSLLVRDQAFFQQSNGGVSFSGGEPLLQVDFLENLLRACKSVGLHTALDTSGFAAWKILERVYEHVDLFLFDVKLIDERKHKQYTGVSNKLIQENLQRLSAAGARIWLRIPIVPGINDDNENIIGSARLAASLPGVEQVNLLPYHSSAEIKYNHLGRVYQLPALHSPTEIRMQEIIGVFETQSVKVVVGG